MSKSPLEFTREFARFKSNLTRQRDPECQLLIMMEFWQNLEAVHEKTEYSTYIEEYIDLFNSLITEQTIYDFTIDELTNLRNILIPIINSKHHRSENRLDQNLKLATYKLATLLFYVGDIETAIPLCQELLKEQNIKLPEIADLARFDSFDLLAELISYYNNYAPSLASILKDIYDRWEAERACVNFDRAVCLFVEKTQDGKVERGRLRILKGTVEINKSASKDDDETDAVTFDNQIKTPDDPFIGVAYDSLEAVRAVLKKMGFNRKSDRSYRAYFSIDESQQTFTGDSIGLAMGLISYSQLMKTEIMRQQRFIANEVALTGGIDSDGNLLPVNMETLKLKVERAFYSSVKYIVVPEGCYADAKGHIDKLAEIYPRRRLQLIGHSVLTDVIDDLNVLRSEKVCIGQYITKKVVKYSRATKIQVPLLLILIYFIASLIFPEITPWFDRNPAFVQVHAHGFKVLNDDRRELWKYEFNCKIDSIHSQWDICDIDKNGKNEIGLLIQTKEFCDINANLFIYNHKGELLFRRNCIILEEYPGDTTYQASYEIKHFNFIEDEDSILFFSAITKSYLARSHIKVWNNKGNLIGWYINSGYCGGHYHFSKEKSGQLLFLGMNNRMNCASMFAISSDSCYGVSPPYIDALKNVKRGNQICYILFPYTDIIEHFQSKYNSPHNLSFESKDIIKAEIRYNAYEKDKQSCCLTYYFNDEFRVIDVKADDGFFHRREKFIAEGKLPAIDWSTYLTQMRDKVTYWTDSGWVTEGELRAQENSQ